MVELIGYHNVEVTVLSICICTAPVILARSFSNTTNVAISMLQFDCYYNTRFDTVVERTEAASVSSKTNNTFIHLDPITDAGGDFLFHCRRK